MALIPPDAGLRIRLTNDSPLQPLARPQEIPADLPELRTGQRFIANIQEVLPDNSYRALVAGKSVTLSLPEAAKAGDTLELVVIDRTPRSILAQIDNLRQGQNFSAHILEVLPGNVYRATVAGRELMLQLEEPAQAGQTLDLRVVDRSPLTIVAERVAQPETGVANYPYATLSRAARLIGELLTPEGESAPAAPLARGQPLLAQGPASVTELAAALAKAVTQSGLFYEAHQAQWVAGKRPLAALLAEPQGGHSEPPLLAAQTRAALAASAPQTDAESKAALVETSAEHKSAGAASIPDDLRPLVQQQLDAVATQRLLWHGEIWPGQEMEWQVERKKGDERSGSEAEQSWSTRLRLTTPGLGQIKAAVSLAGGNANLVIATANIDVAARLRGAAPALEQALTAAGVAVLGISVKHEAA